MLLTCFRVGMQPISSSARHHEKSATVVSVPTASAGESVRVHAWGGWVVGTDEVNGVGACGAGNILCVCPSQAGMGRGSLPWIGKRSRRPCKSRRSRVVAPMSTMTRGQYMCSGSGRGGAGTGLSQVSRSLNLRHPP